MGSKFSAIFGCLLAALFALLSSAPGISQTRTSLLSLSDKRYLETGSFQEVHTIAAIPQSVKVLLAEIEKSKHFAMADPGQPFQATDVVTDPSLPWRRLIFAGLADKYCLVLYEYGGFAAGSAVLLFKLEGSQAKLLWGAYTGNPKNMREFRHRLDTYPVYPLPWVRDWRRTHDAK